MDKQCKRCKAILPISEFYTHAMMKDGHLSFCKKCTKDRIKTYTIVNPDIISAKEKQRNSLPHRKAITKRLNAEWRINNPEKSRAHNLVEKALKRGDIVKSPCVICGCEKSCAHHEDYTKPLQVVWLCNKHHRWLHAGRFMLCKSF